GDFLAPLNNFPATVLLVLSGIELARLLGVGILLRHLGILALVSNYVVSHQLLDNKNDVAAAALFLSALAYTLRYAARFRRPDLILAAICLGLLSGIKYYALLYAAVGLAAMVALTARCRGRRAALGAAAMCLAGIVIWGGYWYGRNLWATGTPLYPRGITAEQNVQSGVRADLLGTTLLGNPAPEKWPLWLEALWRITGPCHLGALVLLPAGLLWLGFSGALLARTQAGHIQRDLRLGLLGVTLASAVLYGVTPFTIEIDPGTLNMLYTGYVTIRMALPFLSLAVLCALVLVDETVVLPAWWQRLSGPRGPQGDGWLSPPPPRRLIGRVLGHGCLLVGLVALAYQVVVVRRLQGASFVIDEKLSGQLVPAVLVGVDLLALGVILLWLRGHLMRWPRLWRALSGAALLTVAAVAAGLLGQRWHGGFAAHYDDFFRTGVFSFLESSLPAGERICVFAQRPYPFAGSRRQFLLLAAHPTAVQPERFRSPEAVLRFLRDQGASIVAIRRGSRFWYGLRVDQWASGHPGVFQTILDSGTFDIRRINRQHLGEALDSFGQMVEARSGKTDRRQSRVHSVIPAPPDHQTTRPPDHQTTRPPDHQTTRP
ncbi:MAG TPA: hypothetical protein G4O05_04930, partial [Caldilineae bacterium]|nr:hypothetical protein [Caldilineae bacterium]